jgi:phospholipid/cholesterol/gamma-HCH transport system ATP-binding protein
MIEIIEVHKSFKSKDVLRGISFTVLPGEVFTIIGGSGSGKSVLLKHIIGLLRPDKGTIKVDGVSILSLSSNEILSVQKKFGVLFQGAALFDSLTVYENVAFGLKTLTDFSEEKIKKCVTTKLNMVGLNNVEHLKPFELSGGMRKRVGLARAIAYEPKYIIYDEPTTGLDPVMSDVINELILSLKEKLNVTSIVVTHDMNSAYKISDRMAMIYEGKLIKVGTPTEISESSNSVVQNFITSNMYFSKFFTK